MTIYNYRRSRKSLLERYKHAEWQSIFDLYDQPSKAKQGIYQQLYNKVSYDKQGTVRIWGGYHTFSFGWIDEFNILHIKTYKTEYTYEPYEY